MNINRNNYEEYFLLYADKELSADEKNMVEMFVQQNPDLEEEFVMLQQSVLKPDDTIALEDKKSLFRNEEFIDQNNYEDKFLLYTDNELSSAAMEATEKFVLANPSLQHEFNLLQKVTYEPDTSIVFPEKRLLYKKEEDTKIIPFPWRYLAAAVLLGIGLWIGMPYLQKDKVKPDTVVKQNVPKVNNPVKINEPKEVIKDQSVKIENTQTAPEQKVKKNEHDNLTQPQQNATVKNNQPTDKKSQLPDKPVDAVKNEIVKLDNDLPKPLDRIPVPVDKTAPVGESITSTPAVQNNNRAVPASYIEDAEVKSENYVFYNITAEEFKKSKIGNFLKKAKRVVASKIPLINKSLKIGNVEIARDDQN